MIDGRLVLKIDGQHQLEPGGAGVIVHIPLTGEPRVIVYGQDASDEQLLAGLLAQRDRKLAKRLRQLCDRVERLNMQANA